MPWIRHENTTWLESVCVAAEEDKALYHEDSLNGALEDRERRLIQESLHKNLWNRGQAADLLKISRWTLQRKMQKYNLVKREVRV